MKEIWNFICRHIVWLLIGFIAILLLKPDFGEIRTLLLVAIVESLALALSGIALFVYTKIDFTKEFTGANPGYIFLGVHICVGLVVLGVYIAQIAS